MIVASIAVPFVETSVRNVTVWSGPVGDLMVAITVTTRRSPSGTGSGVAVRVIVAPLPNGRIGSTVRVTGRPCVKRGVAIAMTSVLTPSIIDGINSSDRNWSRTFFSRYTEWRVHWCGFRGRFLIPVRRRARRESDSNVPTPLLDLEVFSVFHIGIRPRRSDSPRGVTELREAVSPSAQEQL